MQLLYGHGVSTKNIKGYGNMHIDIDVLMMFLDIVVDNCAICRNHIMDLCENKERYEIHNWMLMLF